MNVLKNFKILSAVILCTFFSLCFFNSKLADAAPNIKWRTTDVKLTFKKAMITGYFQNTGDQGAYVTKIRLVLDVKTQKDNGAPIWSDVSTFEPEKKIYVPAGGKTNHNFHMLNDGCPEWNGYCWWYVSYHNLSWVR